MSEELVWKSAISLRDMICRGEISSEELIHIITEKRLNRVNDKINAVVTINHNAYVEAKEIDKLARNGICKPLHGVPITIKDNIWTKGMRTTYGSMLYKDFVPDKDSVIAERLRNAGAIILGKTNLPEFGLIPITDNPLFGPTRNPWDLERTPGGSSGGSAAAVAAGIGPISIGNDGGGSIRIPSSFCGVFGFKPSPFVIPKYPPPSIFRGISSDGPITRYVIDAIITMQVLAGPDYRDRKSLGVPKINFEINSYNLDLKNIKIAFSRNLGYAVVDPIVEKIVENAAYKFRELGAEVEEVNVTLPNIFEAYHNKKIAELAAFLGDNLDKWKSVAYYIYREIFIPHIPKVTLIDYIKVEDSINILWDKLSQIFVKYNYLITPTVSIPAFKLEEGLGPKEINGNRIGLYGWTPFTYPFNLTGQPAAGLPVGLYNGKLPVGMQIIGKPYDDMGVLKLALEYEKSFPYNYRPPI